MDLWTDTITIEQASADDIRSVILALPLYEFAILQIEDEIYMQTMLTEHGYLLEKREGNADSHFEAVPKDGRKRIESRPVWWAFWEKSKSIYYFSAEEVILAFQEYLSGNPNPDLCTWNQIYI